MSMPINFSYVLGTDSPLIFEPLDDMTVIYQRRSGITHLIAEPLPQILALMGTTPQNAEDIACQLAAAFDVDAGADSITQVIAARLEELAELGILERIGA
jgi:PqqD family protein of HPr-rel-A system